MSTSTSGESTSTAPTTTSSSWVMKSMTASSTLTPVDSLTPKMLIAGQQRDHDRADDDVAGPVAQRLPEQPADVVRHEERRDGDRADVGEHLRPGGEERPELVERAPGERGRAARLRVHRGRLGVGRRRAEEEEPGDHEDHRREAERVGRDQARARSRSTSRRSRTRSRTGRSPRARARGPPGGVLPSGGDSRLVRGQSARGRELGGKSPVAGLVRARAQ